MVMKSLGLKKYAQGGYVSPKMGDWVASVASTGLDFQDTITSQIWTNFA